MQANEGLGKFSLQLEAQNAEIKQQQLQLQEAKEAAAVSRTQLDTITQERPASFRHFAQSRSG